MEQSTKNKLQVGTVRMSDIVNLKNVFLIKQAAKI